MAHYADDRHRLPPDALCWCCAAPATTELVERIDHYADQPVRYPLCRDCLDVTRRALSIQRRILRPEVS